MDKELKKFKEELRKELKEELDVRDERVGRKIDDLKDIMLQFVEKSGVQASASNFKDARLTQPQASINSPCGQNKGVVRHLFGGSTSKRLEMATDSDLPSVFTTGIAPEGARLYMDDDDALCDFLFSTELDRG